MREGRCIDKDQSEEVLLYSSQYNLTGCPDFKTQTEQMCDCSGLSVGVNPYLQNNWPL